jgi:hypothetical protein
MDEHVRTRQVITGTEEVVNPETGELTSVPIAQTVTFMAGTKDEFYLVYSKLISLIIEGNLSGPEIKVYAYLLKTYGVGVPITLGKGIKQIMADLMGIKIGTIDNAISALSSRVSPLLFRKEKSVYYLNPRFALKGSSSERDSQMRILFELGCKNC